MSAYFLLQAWRVSSAAIGGRAESGFSDEMPRLDNPSYSSLSLQCWVLLNVFFFVFMFCPFKAKPAFLIGSVPLLKTKLDIYLIFFSE